MEQILRALFSELASLRGLAMGDLPEQASWASPQNVAGKLNSDVHSDSAS
jgi:hypothetical protein